jgi:hypothetical protein
MRRLLKLWMICLISLALPIQGAAAASMVMCGMSQHMSHPTAGHDHAAHAEASVGEHSESASKDAGKQDATKLAKCSACSSCCAAGALPPTVVDFEGTPALDRFFVIAGSAPASFLPGGPERPPRFLLA